MLTGIDLQEYNVQNWNQVKLMEKGKSFLSETDGKERNHHRLKLRNKSPSSKKTS